MLEDDIKANKAIGHYGALSILEQSSIEINLPSNFGDTTNNNNSNGNNNNNKVKILTHCNTGSLATAGYGTALGVIRALHEMRKLGACSKNFYFSVICQFTKIIFDLVHKFYVLGSIKIINHKMRNSYSDLFSELRKAK